MSTPTSAPSSNRVRGLAGRVGFLPAVVLLATSQDLGHWLPDRFAVPVPMLLGVASGVLWQCLRRKDLVDRLTGGAVMAVLVSLVLLLPGTTTATGVEAADSAAGVASVVGILSGLVLAEEWLRQRVRP